MINRYAPKIVMFLGILLYASADLFAEYIVGQNISVVIREARLMPSASHWAKPKAVLVYGDRISIRNLRSSPWIEIETASGTSGFIHESAVTTQSIVLRGNTDVGPSTIESTNVVLAGKGFNSDVEEMYKSQEHDLDYSIVDQWEKRVAAREDLYSFAQQGGLNVAD